MTRPDPIPFSLRCLLRLYPRAYRERFGAEMVDLLRRERAEAGSAVGFWLRAIADHAAAAWAVRRRGGEGMTRRMLEDLGSAARSLRRAPLFAAFAVGTLALGVGATTAVFTVLDRVVLRPLPFEGSERLMAIGSDFRHDPGNVGPLSPLMLRDLEDDPGPAEVVAGVGSGSAILAGRGDPSRVRLSRVSRDYFGVFEGRAAAGRLLDPADHAAGAAAVAVLGHAFWTERFGADPSVVGASLDLDGVPTTVVGVLDPGFLAPAEHGGGREGPGDVWVPLDLRNAEPARGSFFIRGVARLRPGASPAQLDAHLDRVTETIYPPGDGPAFIQGATLLPLRERVVGEIGSTLGRVMAAVGLLLLIACVNVASLLLTRGAERVRELAVRAALGASRARLVRHLLAESLVLALVGGALGGALALGAVSLFRRWAPSGIPRLAEASLDLRGFGFSLALGMATALVFGLLPALRAARIGSRSALGSRGSTEGRREGRLRGALVLCETALAVVLVVGSGLLAHDLVRLATEDPGFERDGLVGLRLDLAGRIAEDDDPSEETAFWSRALEAARALPGARAVALASELPYTDDGSVIINTPEGWEDPDDGAFIPFVGVAGDYLETMGIRLVRGRGFTPAEATGQPMAALVNEAFVRQYWPGRDGVGMTIKSGRPGVDDEGAYEVVGVVADVRHQPGEEPIARMYVPALGSQWQSLEVVVRTEGDPAAMGPALRELVRRLDPGLPVTSLRTVESLASASLARPRFYTGLFGFFAAVALLLAVVGVYGTTAYATRSRTREIGIRLALGARRERVVGTVVGRTGAVVLGGVLAGLALASVSARFMGDVLLSVDPHDSLTYAAVGLVVLAAGVAAAWVPAARAGRVDPASSLREEA